MAHKYTKEQKEWLIAHVKGVTTFQLTEMFNTAFQLDLKRSQIRAYLKNNKLTNGIFRQFKKGHVPYNKGTKTVCKANKTSFKKGHVPANYKPVGSERIDEDGYVLVKVQDTGTWQERWKHKGKIMWEKYHNQEVPKGYAVIFADQNKLNFAKENLVLISKKELLDMNRKNRFSRNSEITKTNLNISKLDIKLREIKKGLNSDEKDKTKNKTRDKI